MKLNHIIIHELKKEQNKPIQPSNIQPSVLDPCDNAVIRLMKNVVSLYGKRKNTAQYGIFVQENGRGMFPDKFEVYAEEANPSETKFIELTKTAMESLYINAQNNNLATGGYILFADYENDTKDHFFLSAMIKQKPGITLSEQLKPEELTQLDLDKLTQAARINFGKIKIFLAERDEQKRQEMNYLSFVSSRYEKSAASYFISAFGCTTGTASAQATRALIKGSVDFFAQKEELKDKKLEFRTALYTYLNEKFQKREPARLHEIEEVVRLYIPKDDENRLEELLNEFTATLNSEELAVPNEFPVNSSVLKKNTHISGKQNNWEFKFDKVSLGDTEDAEVYFDRKNKKLSIGDLPQSMIDSIENELNERQNNRANHADLSSDRTV